MSRPRKACAGHAMFAPIVRAMAIVTIVLAMFHIEGGHCHQVEHRPQMAATYHGGRSAGGDAFKRLNRTTTMMTSMTTTPASSSSKCDDYKDLMMRLQESVDIVSRHQEAQRYRLDNIAEKITHLDATNMERLTAIDDQQADVKKHLHAIEDLQHASGRRFDEFKGEFYALQRRQQHDPLTFARHADELEMARVSRQTTDDASADAVMPLDCSAKLDALSTLLASTRAGLLGLHLQLATNLSSLMHETSKLQRRFNTFLHQYQAAGGGGVGGAGGAGSGSQYGRMYAPSIGHHPLATDCSSGHLGAGNTPAVQRVHVAGIAAPFYVVCDDALDGGGWTVIQHRFNGDVNFQRDWQEYRLGFGNLAGEFFIGLEKLHALTSANVCELAIVMTDWDNVQRVARYDLFAIGDEQELYALNLLGRYTGDAGDALTYHAGSKFSTMDEDNDGWLEGNCAQAHLGAWWYNACEKSNLNGQYLSGAYDRGQTFQGMYWHDFHGPNYSLKSVKMMVRPTGGSIER